MSKTNKAGEVFRTHFTAPRMAYMALFTALAFVVTFLEFPIFPAAPFLKLDFANIFFLMEGFIFGPVEAVVSIALKELLCFMKSTSGGVGELANFIMSFAYILVPSVMYRFIKNKKSVIFSLFVACFIQVGVGLLTNYYINFPLYMGPKAQEYFAQLWQWILYFNIIKSVAISFVGFIIYKPLSRFIRMTSARFDHAVKKRKKDSNRKTVKTETSEENGDSENKE